jgi:hypothetical protein
MSESTEPRAALVFVEDQGTVMALIDLDIETIRNESMIAAFV